MIPSKSRIEITTLCLTCSKFIMQREIVISTVLASLTSLYVTNALCYCGFILYSYD